MGQGLFTVVNLSFGSPVASRIIDSYMYYGYRAAALGWVKLTKVPTLNYFVELFSSYR